MNVPRKKPMKHLWKVLAGLGSSVSNRLVASRFLMMYLPPEHALSNRTLMGLARVLSILTLQVDLHGHGIWSRILVSTETRNGLVNGVTAFEIQRWCYRATAVAATICFATFCLNTTGVPQSWFTNLMVTSLLISGLVLAFLVGWVGLRERAERKAGYTTLRLGDKQLMQRDPYMGRIIRLAGADYLGRQDFAEILERTRAEAMKHQAL
jgi:hypothetical protein